jgi:CDP-diacylglycerol--serine O-phosphatidyltransferase
MLRSVRQVVSLRSRTKRVALARPLTLILLVTLAVSVLPQSLNPSSISSILPHVQRLSRPLFALAIILKALSFVPSRWYANVLSILNLCCGLLGIYCLLPNHTLGPLNNWERVPSAPSHAFFLMFLGQFLDLFDGRAAEKWGSTPRGELFDDVADGTSFGGCVAILIALSFENRLVGAAAGLLHAMTTFFRLIRFVVEKRLACQTGGVAFFAGMPSPAAALVMGAACVLLPSNDTSPVLSSDLSLLEIARFYTWPLHYQLLALDAAKLALCVACAFLSVSRVTYPHFGRVIAPMFPPRLLAMVLLFWAVSIVRAVKDHSSARAVILPFAAGVLYLASPAVFDMLTLKATWEAEVTRRDLARQASRQRKSEKKTQRKLARAARSAQRLRSSRRQRRFGRRAPSSEDEETSSSDANKED